MAEGQQISHTGRWAVKFPSEEVFWSHEMFRIYGLDPETTKLSQQFAFQLIHPEDRAFVREAFERAVRERTGFELDHRAILSDGSLKHIHALGYPVLNNSAELIEYVGTAMDITERNLAEEKLRRSEAYLAETQRLSHTGSWAWNISSGDLFWSLEHFRIFGLDPQTTTPTYEGFYQSVHPDDRSRLRETFEQVVSNKAQFDGKYRIVRPDGTLRHIQSLANPVFTNVGEIVEYIGTVMDITERTQVETALREGEARFRNYFELGLIGMAITSPAKFILEVNDELCRILGYEREELLQKTWAEMTHPDDLAADVAQFNRVMAGEIDGYTLDKQWIRKDGRVLDSIMSAKCLRRADGSVDFFVGLVLDITARKKTEKSLREAHERLDTILDSIEDMFFAVDKEWRYTHFNKQAEEQLKLLGKDPARLLGKVLWDEFPNPSPEDALCRAMSERVPLIHEHFYAPLGEWVEIRIYPGPDGGLVMFVNYVTERKRAEEKLRRSEAHLAEAQRIGHVGSWIWNVSTGECLWSAEHFRIFGLDPETFKPTKENTQRLIHPEDLPFVEQTLERAVRERSNFEVNYRIIWPDGAIRYHQGIGRPVAKQQSLEFIGMVLDVTERRQTEEALRKLQAELAHVTRVTIMGEFAASICHEINQPLGAIVNNSNVCKRLLRKHRGQKQIREVFTDIVEDINRTSAIIARIRLLIKPSMLEKTSLQLKQVVTDVLAVAQGELRTRRITVQTDLAADLPQVSGDRVQLQQVLLNLVMNGSDAMQTAPVERRLLTITCTRCELDGRPAVLLTVRDLGHGFKPEDADRMFEAFYTTKPDGMGMGLRISRSIVEAHGGRLWANPNEGAGTTFSCVLPAAT